VIVVVIVVVAAVSVAAVSVSVVFAHGGHFVARNRTTPARARTSSHSVTSVSGTGA
jgi:hypothetical protein